MNGLWGTADATSACGRLLQHQPARQLITFHRIVIGPLRFLWLRSVSFLNPFDARGDSIIPISLASISIDTGTPGSTPCSVPADAIPPVIVTEPSLSSWPFQTITPDAGPLYAGATGAAGGVGRTGSDLGGGGATCCGGGAGGVAAGGSGAGG
jgi:hypothetical protein